MYGEPLLCHYFNEEESKARLPTYSRKANSNLSKYPKLRIPAIHHTYFSIVLNYFVSNLLISVGNTERKTGDAKQPSMTEFLL